MQFKIMTVSIYTQLTIVWNETIWRENMTVNFFNLKFYIQDDSSYIHQNIKVSEKRITGIWKI